MVGSPTTSIASWGLYVHFPWCVAKCPYCDFNSHPQRGNLDVDGYLAALEKDFATQVGNRQPRHFDSVFFGGGTPSLFPPSAFAKLIQTLQPWLQPTTEITMEANPGSREHWDFDGYREAGINRLSLGAQSFDAQQLQVLGRVHGADDTRRAFELARAAGFTNINLDLMYGLPNQRTAGAVADLQAALALQPEHLSWYQLTIEAKTEFAQRPPTLPIEDSIADMEQRGRALLAAAGYQRYEVSAYAKPGATCQHNLTYWRFGDYLGIGAGAHGKLTDTQGIRRTQKYSQPRRYLLESEHTDTTTVDADAIAAEVAMNVLRLVDGVSENQLLSLVKQRKLAPEQVQAALQPLLSTWRALVDKKLMRTDRFATTPLGFTHLDAVVAEFL